MVWRLAQKRDQRSSPLSIFIMMLAVSDFLYCVHLLFLESLVLDVNLDQTKHLSPISARKVCMTSAWLSLFSCLSAQWATFNIAVYSFQTMSEFCSRCCCSLVHKRSLVITIICQVLINVVIIVIYMIVYDGLSYGDTEHPFDLTLQDYDEYTSNDFFSNWTEVTKYSRRERFAQIFGRCAWAQSNGVGICLKDTISLTHDNHTNITNWSYCQFTFADSLLDSAFQTTLVGSIIASLGTVLTLTCAVLYICFWIKLRARAANLTERSDMHKLRWRLSVIVLLDTFCWIPVTILHWTVFIDKIRSRNIWSNSYTAASFLLISISPAVNPLIYTFTGKNFLHSIRKFCRRMKCDVSVRRTSSNNPDDHTRGVGRCSCIPCIRCVHQDEDNDPDYWPTQDTSEWNSDQSRLLPSTNESSETN